MNSTSCNCKIYYLTKTVSWSMICRFDIFSAQKKRAFFFLKARFLYTINLQVFLLRVVAHRHFSEGL